MSMFVNLAKVSPELLEKIKVEPTLIDAMLFEEKEVAGFDAEADSWGEDYRHVFVPFFMHLAEAAGHGDLDDFDSCEAVIADPMYRGIQGDHEIDYEFCYGPATYNDPAAVKSIAEDWSADFSPDDLKDDERADVAMYLFYKQAAASGWAVIAGIS